MVRKLTPSQEIKAFEELGFNHTVMRGLMTNGDDSIRVETSEYAPVDLVGVGDVMDQDDLLSLRMDTFQDGNTGDDARGDGFVWPSYLLPFLII